MGRFVAVRINRYVLQIVETSKRSYQWRGAKRRNCAMIVCWPETLPDEHRDFLDCVKSRGKRAKMAPRACTTCGSCGSECSGGGDSGGENGMKGFSDADLEVRAPMTDAQGCITPPTSSPAGRRCRRQNQMNWSARPSSRAVPDLGSRSPGDSRGRLPHGGW